MPEASDKTAAMKSRLLPILRDGVEVVKMVFFLRLKEELTTKHPALDRLSRPALGANRADPGRPAPDHDRHVHPGERRPADGGALRPSRERPGHHRDPGPGP